MEPVLHFPYQITHSGLSILWHHQRHCQMYALQFNPVSICETQMAILLPNPKFNHQVFGLSAPETGSVVESQLH